MTFEQLFRIAVGIVEWTVAIASVVGTVALVGWILKMIVIDERSECKPDRAQPLIKDKPDELH
jgi:hypothetical protein